jgi:hypothetical protein
MVDANPALVAVECECEIVAPAEEGTLPTSPADEEWADVEGLRCPWPGVAVVLLGSDSNSEREEESVRFRVSDPCAWAWLLRDDAPLRTGRVGSGCDGDMDAVADVGLVASPIP